MSGSAAKSAVSILILVMTLMYAIFFCGMPFYADDLWYAADIHREPSFKSIYSTWTLHYLTDNARLGNIMLVPMLMLPKWVGSFIAALCWGWILKAGGRLGKLRTDNLPGWCVWLSLTCFLLPWYDSIGSMCYQYNYILPSALNILAILMICSRGGKRGVLIYGITGVITGAWHEGFSLPLFGAILIALALYPSLRTCRVYTLTAGMLAGIIWLLFAPGFIARFNMIADSSSPLMFASIGLKTLLQPALIFVILNLLYLAFKRRIKTLATPANTILLLSALTSYVMHLATLVSPRSGWWCELACIILLMQTFPLVIPGLKRRRIMRYAAAVLMLLTLYRMTLIDINAVNIRRQWDDALAQYSNNPQNAAFVDFTTEYDAPLITLLTPDYTLFLSPVYSDFHNLYLNDVTLPDNVFRVVPSALKNVTANSGKQIEGSLHARTLNGHLFVAADSIHLPTPYSGEIETSVDFGILKKPNVRMIYHTFTSQSDGRKYLYLYPWRQVFPMVTGKIRKIDYTPEISS